MNLIFFGSAGLGGFLGTVSGRKYSVRAYFFFYILKLFAPNAFNT